eukprot:38337-Chlamydomonas_euryale.AAC.6
MTTTDVWFLPEFLPTEALLQLDAATGRWAAQAPQLPPPPPCRPPHPPLGMRGTPWSRRSTARRDVQRAAIERAAAAAAAAVLGGGAMDTDAGGAAVAAVLGGGAMDTDAGGAAVAADGDDNTNSAVAARGVGNAGAAGSARGVGSSAAAGAAGGAAREALMQARALRRTGQLLSTTHLNDGGRDCSIRGGRGGGGGGADGGPEVVCMETDRPEATPQARMPPRSPLADDATTQAQEQQPQRVRKRRINSNV